MPTIEIGAGIALGAQEVTLKKVSDLKTIQVGPEEVDIYEWTFVNDDGEELRDSTSTATGPRSKMFGWITALNGGRPPERGDRIDLDAYVGKRAIATVIENDRGWPKIGSLGAIPQRRPTAPVAAAAPAPSRPAPPTRRPAQAEIAEREQEGDNIPF